MNIRKGAPRISRWLEKKGSWVQMAVIRVKSYSNTRSVWGLFFRLVATGGAGLWAASNSLAKAIFSFKILSIIFLLQV